MSKPLIGITGRRWPAQWLGEHVPEAMRDLHFDLHFSDYPASVAAAGGVPVELTRDADVAAIIARLDGLVLSGGADVEPSRYGHEPDADLGPTEPQRDDWEFALLREARRIELPVLGICRGAQLANVFFGGTLVQHVERDEGSGHPRWDVDGRTHTHDVNIVAGTTLAGLYASTIGVNSLHHQTLGDIGIDLVVGARASDGVVEAVELPGRDFLGVQWHPELLSKPDPTFQWLVKRATNFQARRR
ncbi:MAG: gamma-glutamyl-gamma-aminobutyrate hydrolase family protein [Acidimicrobiaceae bacterium]|nr:gamma-glutamyl-gamma-aminobutyrate hydrolase family protein [Acidimicrobiaceae bacterium]